MMLQNVMLALTVIALSYAGIVADDPKTEPKQDAKSEQKKEEPKKNLMTLKLEHAQKMLAAVAQNDHIKVEQNAQELIKISKELGWKHVRTERYEELSKEYRNELEYLIKAAKFKNNEGMALGYVKTSLACFNCHNHVREVRIAQP